MHGPDLTRKFRTAWLAPALLLTGYVLRGQTTLPLPKLLLPNVLEVCVTTQLSGDTAPPQSLEERGANDALRSAVEEDIFITNRAEGVERIRLMYSTSCVASAFRIDATMTRITVGELAVAWVITISSFIVNDWESNGYLIEVLTKDMPPASSRIMKEVLGQRLYRSGDSLGRWVFAGPYSAPERLIRDAVRTAVESIRSMGVPLFKRRLERLQLLNQTLQFELAQRQ